MAASGKVCTGFSRPFVALYKNNGETVTYSDGQELARGVSVSIEPETSDENTFYANNVAAETAGGVFTGGTLTLTVDGLKAEAEKLILGLPEPEPITVGGSGGTQVEVYAYGDGMAIPYVGVGFVARYMSDGVTTYSPVVLTKTRFNTPSDSAATQEDAIDWQTQELTATLMRDDTAKHNWKKVGADQTSEDAAVAVIKALLSIAGG